MSDLEGETDNHTRADAKKNPSLSEANHVDYTINYFDTAPLCYVVNDLSPILQKVNLYLFANLQQLSNNRSLV